METTVSEKVVKDLRELATNTEALVAATAGQGGEKVQQLRIRAEDSLREARLRAARGRRARGGEDAAWGPRRGRLRARSALALARHRRRRRFPDRLRPRTALKPWSQVLPLLRFGCLARRLRSAAAARRAARLAAPGRRGRLIADLHSGIDCRHDLGTAPLRPDHRACHLGHAARLASALAGGTLRLVRLALVLTRDLASGQLTLRAMSLVYTTLLSIVPLLALSFSVLKAFGVHNQAEPMLRSFSRRSAPKGEEVSHQIIQFIQNMNVGVLGSVGLALLLYTVGIADAEDRGVVQPHLAHLPAAQSGRALQPLLERAAGGPDPVVRRLGMTATAMNIGIVRDVLALEPFGQLVLRARPG